MWSGELNNATGLVIESQVVEGEGDKNKEQTHREGQGENNQAAGSESIGFHCSLSVDDVLSNNDKKIITV